MTDALLSTLSRLLGAEHVSTDAPILAALGMGALKPAALCRPGSTEEIAAVLRLAGEHGVPVLPCGGGSALGWGGPPPAGALALSLKRLDRMLSYEPADMVATAQAGMGSGAFQAALAAHGQWLPLDAPAAATLGGLVATDFSGPRRLAYGTLRDMVLGLTVVNGDAVVRKCGGKVVKNVTGYALEKLYIGSLGTLGIVTEVTLKLRPRPETASVQVMSVPEFEHGLALARELAARIPLAAAVAAFPARPSTVQFGIEAGPADHARLVEEIASAAASAGAAVRGCEGACVAFVEDPAWPPAEAGAVGSEQSSGEGAEAGRPLRARLAWPARAGDFPEQLRRLETLAQEAGFASLSGFFEFPGQVDVALFGPGGPRAGTDAPQEKGPHLDAVLQRLRGEGLSVTVVWKDAALALHEPVFGPPRGEWALMREIKKALDPAGILNPGRFIEGL